MSKDLQTAAIYSQQNKSFNPILIEKEDPDEKEETIS